MYLGVVTWYIVRCRDRKGETEKWGGGREERRKIKDTNANAAVLRYRTNVPFSHKYHEGISVNKICRFRSADWHSQKTLGKDADA